MYHCIYRPPSVALRRISTGRVHLQKGPAPPEPPSRSLPNFIFSTPHTALHTKVSILEPNTTAFSERSIFVFHNASQSRQEARLQGPRRRL